MSSHEVCKVILLRDDQVLLSENSQKKMFPRLAVTDTEHWVDAIYAELIRLYQGNQDSYRLITKLEPNTDKEQTGVGTYVLVLLVADDSLEFGDLAPELIGKVMDDNGRSTILHASDCRAWKTVLPLVQELH